MDHRPTVSDLRARLAAGDAISVLGAMSGTSMDGVDAAVIRTDGVTIAGFGPTAYRAYTAEEASTIACAMGQWPDGSEVAEAAAVVETVHAQLLYGMDGDLVGFHGQTLAHDPANRRTHQAGDGALLAEVLNRPVVWDFRSADVRLGGEGAPLAPAFHHACARRIGATAPVAFLNLGGVGNLTWVDPTLPMEADGALLAFDTGPANAPIDDLCRRTQGAPFDRDGALARQGTADAALVADLMTHPYFARPAPKSLDRDAFRAAGAAIDALAPADAAATWVAAVAASVRLALTRCPAAPGHLLVSGGGRLNPAIMAALSDLPVTVSPVEDAGLDGDMLEAQAFAFLAVRVLRGLPTSFPGTTNIKARVGGGRISIGGGTISAPKGLLDTPAGEVTDPPLDSDPAGE